MSDTATRLPPLDVAAAPAPAWLLALLLPTLLAAAAWLPILAMATLDTDDRAYVWIDGSDTALAAAAAAVAADPAFAGAATPASLAAPPAACAPTALRLHFNVHRVDEAQAARVALEQVAAAAGAHVCATNRFELNVPVQAAHEPLRWLRVEAMQAFVWLLLPVALVAMAFAAPFGAAARARLRTDAPRDDVAPLLLAALAVALAATLVALATSGLVPAWQRSAVSGLSPFFALHEVLVLPLLHELAFRTWLFAQLRPRLPLPAVALVSVVAGSAAALPSTLVRSIAAAVPALACTVLYMRTGRLWPAVALHAAIVALQDARLLAG